MKKFLALFLALVLVFSLVACGKQTEDETKDPETEKVDAAKTPEKETDKDKTDKTGETTGDTASKPTTGDTTSKPTGGDTTSKPTTGDTTSKPTGGDTTSQPTTGGETIAPEDVDLSSFTFGVKEDGNNVLVTVKNQTDAGDVTCVMTFKYDGDTLVSETADYYVPDNDTAKALADELKKDGTIVSDSVKVEGNCVSCTMKDSEIAELRELTRAELVEAMQYAIEATQ